MGTIKETLSSAANTVQHAWRSRHEPSTYPFREYRKKIILIQKCWRERCNAKGEMTTRATSLGPSSQRQPADTQQEAVQSRASDSFCPIRRKRSRKVFPADLPQHTISDWHTTIGPRLSHIVEKALKDSLESSTIDLVGLGLDKTTARPTILVTCTSTARVKAAIKRRFDYDRNIFDVKVCKGRVSLSRGKGRDFAEHDAGVRSSARRGVSVER